MYQSKLNLLNTEIAVKELKTNFEGLLSKYLNLLRVSAPLFLESSTGLNDNLDGRTKPVSFQSANHTIEIVQSLAKWKRMALYRYEIAQGNGIYTDMNAIRPCEDTDEIHSLYVDQWDWEMVISKEERTIDKLKDVVNQIYRAMVETEKIINSKYPELNNKLPENITFITSQELEDLFPSLSLAEKEYEITKMYKAVFIIGIGDTLKSGKPYDLRAPDYDDWSLNGDILFYHEPLDKALEISSMGIRVDANTMRQQLIKANCVERKDLSFHKMVLNEVLPFSIGGGIGQSRLAMFFLEKVHIGEVQVSVWSEQTIKDCVRQGVFLL